MSNAVSSWYGTKPPVFMEDSTAPSATERWLNMGFRIPWMCLKSLLPLTTVLCLNLSVVIYQTIFDSFGINIAQAKIAAALMSYLMLVVWFDEVYTIWSAKAFVSEGVIWGIDLWNLQHFSYGNHWVQFDKKRVYYIPNPKKFYESLEDYYIELTGEPLP